MSSRCLEKGIEFCKYEGAGNDFILIDDRALSFPLRDKAWIRSLCHRRFGIGADGIILLQNDLSADVCMRVLNADGTEAEGCGNGLRCLVQYVSDQKISEAPLRVRVGERVLFAEIVSGGVAVQMGAMQDMHTLSIDGRDIHYVNSGVPHAVLFVEDVDAISLETLAPPLRHHPCFKQGTNVNVAARSLDGTVAIRTYERGVEGETLACGTGAVAVAALGHQSLGWHSPITIRCRGGVLLVDVDDALEKVRLIGPARRVFEGQFHKEKIHASTELHC